MASLKSSGFQRFVEKVLEKFVSRSEITNIIQVTSGATGSLNSVRDGLTVTGQPLVDTKGKVKYIEFFDKNGLLAISATVDDDNTIKNICTRCGTIAEIYYGSGSGYSYVSAIEVNVTTPLGAPAYYKVFAYD